MIAQIVIGLGVGFSDSVKGGGVNELILAALTGAAEKCDPFAVEGDWAVHFFRGKKSAVVQLFNVGTAQKINLTVPRSAGVSGIRVAASPGFNSSRRHDSGSSCTLAVVSALRSIFPSGGSGLDNLRISLTPLKDGTYVCCLTDKPYQPWNEVYGVIRKDGSIASAFGGSGY